MALLPRVTRPECRESRTAMVKWIRNWWNGRKRIAELERELDEAYQDNAKLYGRVERLVANERPLCMARTKYRREVRRLNLALRVRSLRVEVLEAEAKFLRNELKRNAPVIPLRVEPNNDAVEPDPIYTNVSQA